MAARKRKEPRKSWGDPKWNMRRAFVIATCSFCAAAFLLAMGIESPEKIRALAELFGSIAMLAAPVLLGYLGIAEAGSVIRDIKAEPGTQVFQTTEIRETKKPKKVVDPQKEE